MTDRLKSEDCFAVDFIRNLKLFATKFMYDQRLLDAFYEALHRDIDVRCGDKCNSLGHEKKHCANLKFLDIADALEILSIVSYRYFICNDGFFFNF